MARPAKSSGVNKITKVTGGMIARNAATGRFVAVTSDAGTSRATAGTETVVKDAARRRNEALQRLANR